MNLQLEIVLNVAIFIVCLISVIIKLLSPSSQARRKRKLKTDLAILDETKSSDIDKTYRERVDKKYQEIQNEYLNIDGTTVNWFDFLHPLILFAGFGWLTIYIYEVNTDFSPWTILTGLVSFVGLSMVETKRRKKNEYKVILNIIILDDFKYAIIVLGLAFLIGLFIYVKHVGYTNWYILIGVLLLSGFKLLADSMKFK